MNIELAGRTALVTGGAGGIGKACAEILSGAGARVVIADINLAGAEAVAGTMAGGVAIHCDLGDPNDVAALCWQIAAEVGAVDILINNAGIIAYRKGIGAVATDDWDRLLDVNLRGPFLLCRELIEPMKKRNYGKIINFSSLAARVGGIDAGLHYSVSKAGLIGLTKSLAKEGGPHNVCVNAVAPGFITTDPVRRQIAGREQDYIAQIPLRRLGTPADVANVVLFLASPLSDYITGLVIDVNGGMYMG